MIFDNLKKDKIQAMKDGKRNVSGLLSVVIGDCSKNDKNPDDEAVLATIKSFIKKLNETLTHCKTHGNSIGETKCYAELAILELYLPQQLSVEGLKAAIGYAIADGATNLGAVMKYLMTNHKDRYDGKVASQLVKEAFSV